MKNNKIIKNKILFRATHRGTKEMDLLLGRFVEKYINELNEIELVELNKLVLLDDEKIHTLYFEKSNFDHTPKSELLKKFQKFKL
jgi:antitoxin CptB